jgi:Tfp pilus assembly protein, tip-associated adhesin PilY1
MWNGNSGNISDIDGTNVPPSSLLSGITVYGQPLVVNTSWPAPIRDTKTASDTLADVALKYWMTDLRTGEDMPNNVIITAKDPATWQHLNFYGMGFGVRGTLPSKNQAVTLERIKSADSADANYYWPAPSANKIENIDDLWHASVNGFGRYVSATSPSEFRSGLRSILTEILNLGGARSGSALTSRDLSAGDQYSYSAAFAPGWSGDVVKKRISSSGSEGGVSGSSAATRLAALLTPDAANPNPWESKRKIFTRTAGGAGTSNAVPFTVTGLSSSSLINNLGNSSEQRKNVIAYLRGDRSNEGDGLGKFRARGEGPLGDIVNAKAVVVATPYCILDPDDPSEIKECTYKTDGSDEKSSNPGYETFFDDYKSRDTMVYVASNDGMLHAFDENLNEKWAYVPMDILRSKDKAGLIRAFLI